MSLPIPTFAELISETKTFQGYAGTQLRIGPVPFFDFILKLIRKLEALHEQQAADFQGPWDLSATPAVYPELTRGWWKLTTNVAAVDGGDLDGVELLAGGQLACDGTTFTYVEDPNLTAIEADIATADAKGAQAIADAAAVAADLLTEVSDRQAAVNALQALIDAINAAQNLADVVGTKAALDAYDTTNLQDGDKIRVMTDETEDDSDVVYSWNGVDTWTLVGSIAASYSKAEMDVKLGDQQYEEENEVTSGEAITSSINKLDKGLKVNADDNYLNKKNFFKSFRSDLSWIGFINQLDADDPALSENQVLSPTLSGTFDKLKKQQIEIITITGPATATGNITFTFEGTGYPVAVTDGDDAATIAAALAAVSVAGWTFKYNAGDDYIVATRDTAGEPISATTFADTDTTGVTAIIDIAQVGDAVVIPTAYEKYYIKKETVGYSVQLIDGFQSYQFVESAQGDKFFKELYVINPNSLDIETLYIKRNQNNTGAYRINFVIRGTSTVVASVDLTSIGKDPDGVLVVDYLTNNLKIYAVVDWKVIPNEKQITTRWHLTDTCYRLEASPAISNYLNDPTFALKATPPLSSYFANSDANTFFKELFLVNKYAINIRCKYVENTASAGYRINFLNDADEVVAIFQEQDLPTNNGILEIIELSSSGVSGYAIVDWSAITYDKVYNVNTTPNSRAYNILFSPTIKESLSIPQNLSSYTTSDLSNKFFKELYMLNPDDLDITVKYIRRDQDGSWWMNLLDGDNNLIALYSETSEVNGLINIPSYNKSGISGYAYVDWSVLNTGQTTMNALLKPNAFNLDRSPKLKKYFEKNKFIINYPKIVVWIDDDIGATAIPVVKTICDNKEIKCTFAAIVGQMDATRISLLTQYQDEGFHIANHSMDHSNTIWTPATNDFAAKQALEADMIESKIFFRDNGFLDADYMIYPFGGASDDFKDVTIQLAKKHFKLAFKASGPQISYDRVMGWDLLRINLTDPAGEAARKLEIDEAAKNGESFTILTHSAYAEFDQTYMESMIDYIKAAGYTFMTLPEFYKYREFLINEPSE